MWEIIIMPIFGPGKNEDYQQGFINFVYTAL